MIYKIRERINPPYSKKDLAFVFVTVFLLIIAIPLTVISVQRSQDFSTKPSAIASENKIVENQTLKLLSLNSDLSEATAGKKQAILKQMETISADRAKRLSSIIEKNPQQILKVNIPPRVKKDLPKKIRGDIEKKVKLKGIFEFAYEDYPDGREASVAYLRTKNKVYRLFSEIELPAADSGANVTVSGVAIGDKVAVEGKIKKNKKVLGVGDAKGVKNVAVILLNFQNSTSRPISAAGVNEAMFTGPNSVADFWQESSFNQMSLTGDVYGWYTASTNLVCDIRNIQSAGLAAANADVNYQDYDGILFVISSSCGWIGVAWVGNFVWSTPDGPVDLRIAVVVTGSTFRKNTTSHEMGHGFRARHANFLECGSVSIGNNCSSVAYKDPYDTMGNSANRGHFNAYHKEFFNWFDPPNIKTVTTAGTYTIGSIERPISGPQIIKVARDRDNSNNPLNWLYVEYRERFGFDSNLLGDVYDGALVHWAPKNISGNGVSQLLDMSPSSFSFSQSVLPLGQTFSDTAAGVNISVVDKTTSNLDVQVNFGSVPCTRINPTVSISPSQIFARPGTAVNYTVTVNNNDTSQCGSSSFSLSPNIPNGWSSGFSPSSLSLNPGSSGQSTFTVTSATSAADGFYTVTARATNQSDTNFSGTASATYAVSDDLTDPSVSITSPTQNQTVSGTVSVEATATDDVGVTKVEFLVDNILKFTDTTSPYSFSWDTTTASDGSHTLSAKAYDAAGNMGASTNVSVTVSNIDNQAPTVFILTSGRRGGTTTVSGVYTIQAYATDNVGVTKVEFYVDGALIGEDITAPYAIDWDTTTVSNGGHAITAKAYDAAGNVGTSNPVTFTVNNINIDTEPPTTPTGLTADAPAHNRVDLSWTASTDNVGVAGYWVVRNGVTIADVTSGTSYADTSVSQSTTYQYHVLAYDAAENFSGNSNTATVTTPSQQDTQAPTVPQNLSASAVSSSQINLAWSASSDNVGVNGYEVYRDNVKIATVSTTSYGDTGLSPSTTYQYYVKALDAAGNVSGASNTVSATTQDESQDGILTGQVTDSTNNQVIVGATVYIKIRIPGRRSGSQIVTTTTTNSSGVYVVTLEPGTYEIEVNASNYSNQTRTNVSVTAGSVTTINFSLSPTGGSSEGGPR